MATPHISCEMGEIAERVIMPGDPARAERIAKTYLTDIQRVSYVRGNGVFTGKWDGTPISVLASGMGIPSTMIYATELFRFFGVKRICRVGTAGAMLPTVQIRDVVIATCAHTSSRIGIIQVPDVSVSLTASFEMLVGAVDYAKDVDGLTGVHLGPVFSSDYFYLDRADISSRLASIGTLAVEMEAAGLYAASAREGGAALTVVTISDAPDATENLTAVERETEFTRALQICVAGLLA